MTVEGFCQNGGHVIERVSDLRSKSFPLPIPRHGYMARECTMVRDVLLMLQGFESHNIFWDQASERFTVIKGLRFAHITESSFHKLLGPLLSAATSLRKIEQFVKRASYPTSNDHDRLLIRYPTLQAFTNVVSMRLQFLRRAAMEKELEAANQVSGGPPVTLLGIVSGLSWVCAGAVFLEYAVETAMAGTSTLRESSAAELASNILTALYSELNEFCLVRDGGEQAYRTLFLLFVGSLQPLVDSLDTWIQEGILNDPVDELFFYADKSVTVEDDKFWLQGYKLRSHLAVKGIPQDSTQTVESLKLTSSVVCETLPNLVSENIRPGGRFEQRWSIRTPSLSPKLRDANSVPESPACPAFLQPFANSIVSAGKSLQILRFIWRQFAQLSGNSCQFHEVQLGDGFERSRSDTCAMWATSLMRHLQQPILSGSLPIKAKSDPDHVQTGCVGAATTELCSAVSLFGQFAKSLEKFFGGDTFEAAQILLSKCNSGDTERKGTPEVTDAEKSGCSTAQLTSNRGRVLPEDDIEDAASQAILYAGRLGMDAGNGCGIIGGSVRMVDATNDRQALKLLLSSTTLLPSWQESVCLSQSVPTKLEIRLTAGILHSIQNAVFTTSPSPAVFVQECLISHIDQQVVAVGHQLLQQLMGEWHLMEELALLRTIFLVGSGDLLQQFSTVLFNKLDRGEHWDDYHELNSMLQESIRSSVNEAALSALDLLAVEIEALKTRAHETFPFLSHVIGQNSTHGIDALESMRFVYKVAWPLELIINASAIKKYNQVMAFLMKVKRAKHVLDKACRFTWKNGGGYAANSKRRFLVQHKLMHFVNTLHQYVMDRVLYSAWVELCEGLSMARSLDEVILCHDAYLTSIQRQCLVAPDKLWTLIASRVKNILSLALDYYFVQCTRCDGATTPAILTKCQFEMERISKQFDECMAFLLRVLSFKLNIGQFPHLVDLITRLNYNYYYMSEHGHLLTPVVDLEQHNVGPPCAGSAEEVTRSAVSRVM